MTFFNLKALSRNTMIMLASAQLCACASSGTQHPEVDSQSNRVDAAIEQAAIDASRHGDSSAGLISLERQYKRNSEDPNIAIAYAKGLRKAGYLNRASAVLTPFAQSETAIPGAKTEMSVIALGLSDYDRAEKYAQQAVIQDPQDYNAYQNLGIALDAKEMHPEAERAFRKGLEHWEGDPTTIMNNLALNLATQGFIDEAVEILEQAKALSPNRMEIERNLRIVRTLNER